MEDQNGYLIQALVNQLLSAKKRRVRVEEEKDTEEVLVKPPSYIDILDKMEHQFSLDDAAAAFPEMKRKMVVCRIQVAIQVGKLERVAREKYRKTS